MTKSQNSRTETSYVVEATYGVTPTTPAMILLPKASFSLDLSKDILEGTDIRSDEMQGHLRHGDRRTEGSITADLRKGDFDPFLESVMRSAWSTDTLKVGTAIKSFTIEDGALDVSQYRLFTGVTVNSFSLSVTTGATNPVQSTFNLMGKDMTISGATVADSTVAYSSNTPFDHHSGSFSRGDVASSTTACVTAISLEIARNYEGAYCVGSATPDSMVAGQAQVTGSATFYFEDASDFNRFINETETEIEVSVDDVTGSNPYTFLIPRAKYTATTSPVSGATGSRMVEVSFTGLYDPTEGSSLVITRTS